MQPLNPEFGRIIRDKRLALGMTGKDLADKVGLSVPFLHAMERAEARPPSTPKVIAMAEVLDLNADSLLAMLGRMRPERWRSFWSGAISLLGASGLPQPDAEKFVAMQLAAIKDGDESTP